MQLKRKWAMRRVLTSGTKLELIWCGEGRCFTLPAVNCYAGSLRKPLAQPTAHYSPRQACGLQIGNHTDFRWFKSPNWWSRGGCGGAVISHSPLVNEGKNSHSAEPLVLGEKNGETKDQKQTSLWEAERCFQWNPSKTDTQQSPS